MRPGVHARCRPGVRAGGGAGPEPQTALAAAGSWPAGSGRPACAAHPAGSEGPQRSRSLPSGPKGPQGRWGRGYLPTKYASRTTSVAEMAMALRAAHFQLQYLEGFLRLKAGREKVVRGRGRGGGEYTVLDVRG